VDLEELGISGGHLSPEWGEALDVDVVWNGPDNPVDDASLIAVVWFFGIRRVGDGAEAEQADGHDEGDEALRHHPAGLDDAVGTPDGEDDDADDEQGTQTDECRLENCLQQT